MYESHSRPTAKALAAALDLQNLELFSRKDFFWKTLVLILPEVIFCPRAARVSS